MLDYGKDFLCWGHIIIGCDFGQSFIDRKMLLELFKVAENDESAAHDLGSFYQVIFFLKSMPEHDSLSRLDLKRVC